MQGSLDLDLLIQNKQISVAFNSLLLPCKLLATVFEIKLHYPPGECGHHIMVIVVSLSISIYPPCKVREIFIYHLQHLPNIFKHEIQTS